MKRRLLKLGLLLLLGAIANVAVAWGLAYFCVPQNPTSYSAGATLWTSFGSERWFHFVGAAAYTRSADGKSVTRTDVEGLPDDKVLQLLKQTAYGSFMCAIARKTGIAESMDQANPTYEVPVHSPGQYAYWAVDLRGWPSRAMLSAYYPEPSPDGVADLRGGVLLTRYERTRLSSPAWVCVRVLPTRIAWPGFAINTTFYAAILGMLFFGPGRVRRTIRRTRGLCPACAYPVGTSEVCTECGGPVGG